VGLWDKTLGNYLKEKSRGMMRKGLTKVVQEQPQKMKI
jgi:hypothetical protein